MYLAAFLVTKFNTTFSGCQPTKISMKMYIIYYDTRCYRAEAMQIKNWIKYSHHCSTYTQHWSTLLCMCHVTVTSLLTDPTLTTNHSNALHVLTAAQSLSSTDQITQSVTVL